MLQALEWRAAAQLMFHLDAEQSPSRRLMSNSSLMSGFLHLRAGFEAFPFGEPFSEDEVEDSLQSMREEGQGRKAKGISKAMLVGWVVLITGRAASPFL